MSRPGRSGAGPESPVHRGLLAVLLAGLTLFAVRTLLVSLAEGHPVKILVSGFSVVCALILVVACVRRASGGR